MTQPNESGWGGLPVFPIHGLKTSGQATLSGGPRPAVARGKKGPLAGEEKGRLLSSQVEVSLSRGSPRWGAALDFLLF